MDERAEFSELLKDLLEQAAINDNCITQKEIQDVFSELKLNDGQMEHVCNYLAANKIKVVGFVPRLDKLSKAESDPLDEGEGEENREAEEEEEEISESAVFKMYVKDLKAYKKLSRSEETEMLQALMQTEEGREVTSPAFSDMDADSLRDRYIHHKLHYVVNVARKHALGGALLDELIQEGNIGLLLAVTGLSGVDANEAVRIVNEGIEQAMEEYINAEYANDNEARAMIAKVSFVSEAAKKLKDETGAEPSIKEMADYTNMSEEELMDIINLSADNLKADNK